MFLALCLVEFQCFAGHFENEYQMCFKVYFLLVVEGVQGVIFQIKITQF